MIEIGSLSDKDRMRIVTWYDRFVRCGVLVSWDTRQLIIDEQWAGDKGRRGYVDPALASFVEEGSE